MSADLDIGEVGAVSPLLKLISKTVLKGKKEACPNGKLFLVCIC